MVRFGLRFRTLGAKSEETKKKMSSESLTKRKGKKNYCQCSEIEWLCYWLGLFMVFVFFFLLVFSGVGLQGMASQCRERTIFQFINKNPAGSNSGSIAILRVRLPNPSIVTSNDIDSKYEYCRCHWCYWLTLNHHIDHPT